METPASRAAAPPLVRSLVIVAVCLAALYALWAGGTYLWDRDEPRFARAAVEMAGSGDYLVPTFNGNLRADKPPLVYWAMQAPLAILGFTELSFRLPAVLGMAISIVLTGLCARWIVGDNPAGRAVALWSAAMMGTCGLALWIGSAAVADGTLLPGMMLCFAAFTARIMAGPARWQLPVVVVGAAWAWLAKGPVGALPVGAYVVYVVWTRAAIARDVKRGVASEEACDVHGGRCACGAWCWKHELAFAFYALVAGVAALVAWGWPANAQTGGALAEIGIGRHVIDRIRRPAEGHGLEGALGYIAALPVYVPFIIAGFFPWTLFAAGGVSAMLRRTWNPAPGSGQPGEASVNAGAPSVRRARRWLWCWLLVVFVVMSLVATKMIHYVLALYPALAIVTAGVLVQRLRAADVPGGTGLRTRDRDWLRAGGWFMGVVAGGLVLGALGAGLVLGGVAGALRGGVVAGIAAGVLTLAILRMREEKRAEGGAESVRRAAVALVVGMPAVVFAALVFLMPVVEAGLKPAPRIAEAVREAVAEAGVPFADADISSTDYDEPTLVFYLNRRHDRPIRQGVLPALWAEEPGVAWLVATPEALEEAGLSEDDPRFEVVATFAAINYADAAEHRDILLLRRGGR